MALHAGASRDGSQRKEGQRCALLSGGWIRTAPDVVARDGASSPRIRSRCSTRTPASSRVAAAGVDDLALGSIDMRSAVQIDRSCRQVRSTSWRRVPLASSRPERLDAFFAPAGRGRPESLHVRPARQRRWS
jgi:hypothetical protein